MIGYWFLIFKNKWDQLHLYTRTQTCPRYVYNSVRSKQKDGFKPSVSYKHYRNRKYIHAIKSADEVTEKVIKDILTPKITVIGQK